MSDIIKKGTAMSPFLCHYGSLLSLLTLLTFLSLLNVTIVIIVPIVPNVIVVPIVTNVLAVLAAPNAYTRFFFFGFSVTIGTSISSIEMPPCWKVSL